MKRGYSLLLFLMTWEVMVTSFSINLEWVSSLWVKISKKPEFNEYLRICDWTVVSGVCSSTGSRRPRVACTTPTVGPTRGMTWPRAALAPQSVVRMRTYGTYRPSVKWLISFLPLKSDECTTVVAMWNKLNS